MLCFKNIILFGLWCQLHLTETLAYARSVWGIRLVVQNMSVGWAARAICVCGGVNNVLFCTSQPFRYLEDKICCSLLLSYNKPKHLYIYHSGQTPNCLLLCAWSHCYNIQCDLINNHRNLYVKRGSNMNIFSYFCTDTKNIHY